MRVSRGMLAGLFPCWEHKNPRRSNFVVAIILVFVVPFAIIYLPILVYTMKKLSRVRSKKVPAKK